MLNATERGVRHNLKIAAMRKQLCCPLCGLQRPRLTRHSYLLYSWLVRWWPLLVLKFWERIYLKKKRDVASVHLLLHDVGSAREDFNSGNSAGLQKYLWGVSGLHTLCGSLFSQEENGRKEELVTKEPSCPAVYRNSSVPCGQRVCLGLNNALKIFPTKIMDDGRVFSCHVMYHPERVRKSSTTVRVFGKELMPTAHLPALAKVTLLPGSEGNSFWNTLGFLYIYVCTLGFFQLQWVKMLVHNHILFRKNLRPFFQFLASKIVNPLHIYHHHRHAHCHSLTLMCKLMLALCRLQLSTWVIKISMPQLQNDRAACV